MRNCLASVCFIATALLLAPAASAQSKKGNKAAAAAPAPKAAKAAAPGKKGAKPAAREQSMDDGDEAISAGSQPPFFGTGEADDAPAPVLGGEG